MNPSYSESEPSLLLVPGPTPVVPQILGALSRPTISHTSAELAEIVRACQDGIRALAGSSLAEVFVFAGSGTLAQEAAIVNLVGRNDRLLVVSNGYFGDRFSAIARAHGLSLDTLESEWGTSVRPDELREVILRTKPAVVAMTHVDTSTGVAVTLSELVPQAKEMGALTIVDCVCSLGGMPVGMDELGIDVVLCGAQKALGVPPGLAILAVSDLAMAKRRSLSQVPGFYVDFLNWEASMQDPQQYFSTHAVNMIFALAAALRLIETEGLSRRFARHETTAREFRAALATYGLRSLTRPDVQAPTLSVLEYPAGVDDVRFREDLAARGVVAAGCLGIWRGRGVRFGHMGNISGDEVVHAVETIGVALAECGVDIDMALAMDLVHPLLAPAV